jgi:uncharacterized protein
MAIAFSGGLDSTLLAAVAVRELGDRALAMTALSPTYPVSEQKEAKRLAAQLGIRHVLVRSNELKIPGFAGNPVNRCYFCKRELFKILKSVARRHGLRAIADGTNADDLGDYRPGRKAAKEWGVVSPLLEVGLGKADIRKLSRSLGLPTADKPSFACLASRFPYGSRITLRKLRAVDRVEVRLDVPATMLRRRTFTRVAAPRADGDWTVMSSTVNGSPSTRMRSPRLKSPVESMAARF